MSDSEKEGVVGQGVDLSGVKCQDSMSSVRVEQQFPNFHERTDKEMEGDSLVTADRKREFEEDRFAGYLSSSFQSVKPLRNNRSIKRNKAIVILVFSLLVFYLIISRFV